VRRVFVGVAAAVVAACAVAGFLPGHARAQAAQNECTLPQKKPLWIDFAEGSTAFWPTFAKPGVIVAGANFIYPAKIRALGAKTVYMDLNFHRRIGSPSAPLDPAEVVVRANKIFDYAAASLRCQRPYMALNELFGAATATPWSPGNALYRADVLLFMKTIAARGGHPFLLINTKPYTGGEAADWWREAASYGDIVREVYFPAPNIYHQGVLRGNRALRQYFRGAAAELLAIGIPPQKIGLMLGFQTTRGNGGREGLQPASAWFDVTKWQALSAREVAKELRLGSIWSWGWEAYSDAERDPDKAGAACVYLWTRNKKLCNGPRAAGAGFDQSLTAGQITFPRSIKCKLDGQTITTSSLTRLARVTGDRDLAFSALFERTVESGLVKVSSADVRAAEQEIVNSRFHRSQAAYRAALARVHAGAAIARGAIGDEIRRDRIMVGLKAKTPSSGDVSDYFSSYGATLTRQVQTKPATWWLNGRKQGLALASSAPPAVMTLRAGKWTPVWTPGGVVRVKPVGGTRPLSAVGVDAARPSIVAALRDLQRAVAFESWTLRHQRQAQNRALCVKDDLPQTAAVDLSDYLPFVTL
jgi:hypothetical protein